MSLKKKILLIYPPSPALNREDRYQRPIKGLMSQPFPPIDLMYLAAIAEQCGYEAKIKDYSLGGDLTKDLQEFAPDYLVANIATPTFKQDMEAVAAAKQLLPSLITIVKGAPFLTYNTNVVYENPFIDYVIIGEAELTLKEILESVPNENIKGICYLDNMQGVKNELRPFNENLDSLPFPARHLIDNSIYKNTLNNKTQAAIKVSRGCPNNCFYCLATAISGLNIRNRTAENIIAEIKECIEKYNIKDFFFLADKFNNDKAWVFDLCKKIIDSGLKITWSTDIIANNIDNETAKIMYKSGCRLVNIGIESGSKDILNNIGKNISLDDIRKTIKTLKKNEIKIQNQFIIGLPWDTEKTVEETTNFAIELDGDYTNFFIATPFPGTNFFAYAMINKLVSENLNFDNAYYEPIVRTHDLSKERVSELRNLAYRKLYLRLKFILRALYRTKTLAELKFYFKTIINLIFNK